MRSAHKWVLAGTGLVTILLTGIAGCRSNDLSSTSSIVYGLTLAPSGIDPHLHASAELGIPLSSVYDTLVYRDPASGKYTPGLAREWSISDEGTRYSFELREDVIFHDGTPFNADAVAANIEYTIDPGHHSFKAALMLGPVYEVEVTGEFSVVFKLTEPYAPLLDALSQVYLGMASPQALSMWGPEQYQFHQVGTGPYRFVEYIPNDHLTLQRFDEYAWGPPFFGQDQAQIETIIFRFYEDAATRSIALESELVDVMGEIPPLEAERLSLSADFELYPVAIPGQPLQFLFNTQRSPTDDLRVRLALIEAVDRGRIVQTVFGPYSPVADAPLSRPTYAVQPGNLFPAFNPAHAAEVLDGAGWIDADGDGIREKDGEQLSLHIVTPTWGSNAEAAQLIKADWEALGTRVTIEVAAGFGPLVETQSEGQYHAIGLNLFDTDPDLLRSFFASEGRYNWTGYSDERLDELLHTAAFSVLDPIQRAELYTEISATIAENALMLPVREYVNLVIARSELKGLRFSAQGWFPLLIELHLDS